MAKIKTADLPDVIDTKTAMKMLGFTTRQALYRLASLGEIKPTTTGTRWPTKTVLEIIKNREIKRANNAAKR